MFFFFLNTSGDVGGIIKAGCCGGGKRHKLLVSENQPGGRPADLPSEGPPSLWPTEANPGGHPFPQQPCFPSTTRCLAPFGSKCHSPVSYFCLKRIKKKNTIKDSKNPNNDERSVPSPGSERCFQFCPHLLGPGLRGSIRSGLSLLPIPGPSLEALSHVGQGDREGLHGREGVLEIQDVGAAVDPPELHHLGWGGVGRQTR